MEGFGLLVGHLLGDYIFQNDWQAANKTILHPGERPAWPWRFGPAPIERPSWTVNVDPSDREAYAKALEERNAAMARADEREAEIKAKISEYNVKMADFYFKLSAYRRGHIACTVHCLLYTLAVWLCSFWWMPWWGLLVCFLAHWPIDRFRLARVWMERDSGQEAFVKEMAPWSVIVVDNTIHLLTLFIIGLIAIRG